MDRYAKLKADAEALYIGNIHTVEADLDLPAEGMYGSSIQWKSEFPYSIDEQGHVTRPRSGTGNREVKLTAVLSLEGAIAQRDFQVTILQKESTLCFVRVLGSRVTIAAGEDYRLPSVAILETDDGRFVTLPVRWRDAPVFSSLQPGTYRVESLPPDERFPDVVACAEIEVTSEAAPPERGPTAVLERMPPGDVHIDGGIWAENKQRMQAFLLSVNDDSMLYNFRDAAGLDTRGAEPMTGWDAPECNLKGHTTGHYLSAVALACCGGERADTLRKNMHAQGHGERTNTACCHPSSPLTGMEQAIDPSVFLKKAKYLVDALAECQDAMAASGRFHPGFLSAYSEEQFDLLEEYVFYPKIWAPYYTLHKIMAGLVDCYELAGLDRALDVVTKLGMWVYRRLHACGEEKRQRMWAMYIAGEFGGMNETMARLHGLTGKPEFLAAAKYFDNEKLFYPMSRNVDTLGGIHANQHIPQIVGALEIYRQSGDAAYYAIARNFWNMVVADHTYCIGGTGEGEMFQHAGGIGAFLTDRTAESCASYNMLKLTGRLFTYEPKGDLMDYYERTLLNHIVASHDQSGPTGGSTYFMPLKPGGEKGFDCSENSCCHGTGLESHLRYQEAAYFSRGDVLYACLYLPSTLRWEERGVTVIQTEDLIHAQRAAFRVEGEGAFFLRLRIPGWLEGAPVITVNGTPERFTADDGFAVLSRRITGGDTVAIELPFALSEEPSPDRPELISVRYGPLVLAAADSRKDFLPWPRGKSAREALIPTDNPLRFRLGDIVLRPGYDLQDGPYHIYFRSC